MNNQRTSYFHIAVQALIAAIVVIFFGNFCRMRTIAWPCLYKEYLSGVLVVILLFLNIYVIYPRFYHEKKNSIYLILTFLSILFTCVAEMVLVCPQILQIALYSTSPKGARITIFMDGLSVLFRDMAIAAFAFLFCALKDNQFQRLQTENTLLTAHNQIQALIEDTEALSQDMNPPEQLVQEETGTSSQDMNPPDQLVQEVDADENALAAGGGDFVIEKLQGTTLDRKNTLVNVEDLLYCQQDQNYTYLFVANGQRLFRYGSMREIGKLLTDSYGVQISRNLFVLYNHIVRFDNESVCLRNPVTSVESNFPISANYRDKALAMLGLHIHSSAKTKKTEHKIFDNLPDKKRKQIQAVYAFVKDHPDCSAIEIKKHKHLSISTIQRIIVILKQENLVEYRGAKRSGGYFALDHGDASPIPKDKAIH